MISSKLVIILGAGAHVPYAFPIGSALTVEIVKLLPSQVNDNHNELIYELFDLYNNKIGNLRQSLVNFRTLLNSSGHSSIDSFLATHSGKEGFSEIGKYIVAKLLLPLEFRYDFSRAHRLRIRADNEDGDQDWLSYLFEKMVAGCLASPSDFLKNNNVSFVTFNYDRTLEHFLRIRLQHTYDLSPEEAWTYAKQIPINHVYGSLGVYDSNSVHGGKLSPSQINTSAASIRLMHEERSSSSQNNSSQIAKIINLISSAQRICFLGFAFDPDNVNLLQLGICCNAKPVYASRYKMPNGEWQRVCEIFHQSNNLVRHPEECREWQSLKFLQESYVLA